MRLCLILICGILTGCASHSTSDVYRRDQAQAMQSVLPGIVEGVRTIKIESARTGTGSVVGATIGGIAGSNLGGGKGSIITSILGAVGGAILGDKVEQSANTVDGLEILVRLDDGRLMAISQEADVSFAIGDRVRVLAATDGWRPSGLVRVTHEDPGKALKAHSNVTGTSNDK